MELMLQLGRSVAMEGFRPDASRRFAIDLNRPTAYWRPLSRVEQKIDFAAMEIADGEALQRSRMRLGLILAAQMTKVIAQTRAPSFGAAQAGRIELPLTKEIGDEFFRLASRAYWDGAQIFDRALARSAQLAGRAVPPSRVYGLSAVGVTRLEAKARKRAAEFCDSLRKQLQPVFDGVFSAAGVRMKPAALLEAEIQTVYSRWIDAPPPGSTVELASKPPLDAETPAEYEAWERRTVPITDWIQTTATRIIRAKQPPPALKTEVTALWLETERTRQVNAGITAAGLKNADTVAFQYTAIRDGRTCKMCRALDGITRDKNDDFWVFHEPPVHWRCRCHRIPIFTWENVKYSTDALLDEIDTSALGPGFGQYDRKANETLTPTIRTIERALRKPKRADTATSPTDRLAAAKTAMDRAAAEHHRAQSQINILKLTQSAEDLAYFRQHGVYRPGSDLARAAAKAQQAMDAFKRAQDQYQNASRAAA